MSKKQRNVQMGLLTAIAAILVVCGHSHISTLALGWLFPYDSFHMPLFMFISGYFSPGNMPLRSVPGYIGKKAKRLLLPFFVWHCIYSLLAVVVYHTMRIEWVNAGNYLHQFFVRPVLYGNYFFGFNDTSWFLLVLFQVSVVNCLLYCLFGKMKFSEWIIWTIYLIGTIAAIAWGRGLPRTPLTVQIPRGVYLSFWYSTGAIYKKHLEKRDRLSSLYYFTIVFILQYVLRVSVKGVDIATGVWNGEFPFNAFYTIAFALTGIAFWLRVSKVLAPAIANSRYVVYLSEHSMDIMLHQTLGFFLLNLCYWKLSNFDFGISFDYEYFRSFIWFTTYPYNGAFFGIAYVVAGILIPVLLAKMQTFMIQIMKGRKHSNYEV